jgi:hypothetical protein
MIQIVAWDRELDAEGRPCPTCGQSREPQSMIEPSPLAEEWSHA